jgi:hypothetical protein
MSAYEGQSRRDADIVGGPSLTQLRYGGLKLSQRKKIIRSFAKA